MKHYFLLLLLIGCIASGRAESGWKLDQYGTLPERDEYLAGFP
jgi:hypothetical protein